MKQTQRVFLECVGEIRQIYKATNVMIKCGGGGASGGGRHYYRPGRIKKGFIDQGIVELFMECVQIRGKISRTKTI